MRVGSWGLRHGGRRTRGESERIVVRRPGLAGRRRRQYIIRTSNEALQIENMPPTAIAMNSQRQRQPLGLPPLLGLTQTLSLSNGFSSSFSASSSLSLQLPSPSPRSPFCGSLNVSPFPALAMSFDIPSKRRLTPNEDFLSAVSASWPYARLFVMGRWNFLAECETDRPPMMGARVTTTSRAPGLKRELDDCRLLTGGISASHREIFEQDPDRLLLGPDRDSDPPTVVADEIKGDPPDVLLPPLRYAQVAGGGRDGIRGRHKTAPPNPPGTVLSFFRTGAGPTLRPSGPKAEAVLLRASIAVGEGKQKYDSASIRGNCSR